MRLSVEKKSGTVVARVAVDFLTQNQARSPFLTQNQAKSPIQRQRRNIFRIVFFLKKMIFPIVSPIFSQLFRVARCMFPRPLPAVQSCLCTNSGHLWETHSLSEQNRSVHG